MPDNVMFADLDEGSGGGDRFKAAEHDGELLLFCCSGISENVQTNFGVKEMVVEVDRVAVLDGPSEGTEYHSVRIFNTVLVNQLKTAAQSKKVAVGRLGKGVAGTNGFAPWKLANATDDERDRAKKWLDTNYDNGSNDPGSDQNPPF